MTAIKRYSGKQEIASYKKIPTYKSKDFNFLFNLFLPFGRLKESSI